MINLKSLLIKKRIGIKRNNFKHVKGLKALMIEIITFIFALITPIVPLANKYLNARIKMIYHFIPAFITITWQQSPLY